MKKFLWSLMGVSAFLVGAQVAHSALTGTQTFSVVVPSNISITAPASPAALTLPDNSDLTLSFPAQSWAVKGNSRNGVAVTFAVAQPFVNASDTSYKRDARLSLSAAGTPTGPGVWTIGTATDSTNYAASDNVAAVSVTSNRTGQANFNLGVEFLTVENDEVAEGTYSTVVTGTVSAN